jgi:hypothetical protein
VLLCASATIAPQPQPHITHMIIHAVLYSPTHPPTARGVPFFERSFTNFESRDEIPQSGARQLAHILKEGKFIVQLGATSELELSLPCEDLPKHIGTDTEDNMTLEMIGILPEIDERLVSILEEDGWNHLNSPLFFELFGIAPVQVH